MLSPGDLFWVNIPGVGYVGVGRVTESVQSVNDFTVVQNGERKLAKDVLSTFERLKELANDPEKAEQFVAVEWLQTVPENEAIKGVGFFGNQNTVCQPTSPKWRHTVERLKTHFPKWNTSPK